MPLTRAVGILHLASTGWGKYSTVAPLRRRRLLFLGEQLDYRAVADVEPQPAAAEGCDVLLRHAIAKLLFDERLGFGSAVEAVDLRSAVPRHRNEERIALWQRPYVRDRRRRCPFV